MALGPLLALACRDPVDPPPAPGPPDLPRWSTAPHVLWAGPSTPAARPLVLVVDQPGGPVDALLADSDVATFLNDRFTPIFLIPERAGGLPAPSLQVLGLDGCTLVAAFQPASAAEIIAAGNRVMQAQARGQGGAPRPAPPLSLAADFPPGHPLLIPCPAP